MTCGTEQNKTNFQIIAKYTYSIHSTEMSAMHWQPVVCVNQSIATFSWQKHCVLRDWRLISRDLCRAHKPDGVSPRRGEQLMLSGRLILQWRQCHHQQVLKEREKCVSWFWNTVACNNNNNHNNTNRSCIYRHVYRWLKTVFGLVIGFIDHLHVATTMNYNTLRITVTITHK
jgi:hypothetical protein